MVGLLQKIKQAFSSSPGTDGDAYPNGQATHNGRVTYFNRLLPYGLSSLEPEGAYVLLLNQESVKFGIPSAMQLRKKSLQQGEVALYNSVAGVWIYIKADGSVEINGDTTIDGDLTVTGDVIITGECTIGGIAFSTHVHGNVQSGSSNTGPPA